MYLHVIVYTCHLAANPSKFHVKTVPSNSQKPWLFSEKGHNLGWGCSSVGSASDSHTTEAGINYLMRQGIFLSVSNFSADSSYDVSTPMCATASINICAHVKDSLVHVRVQWITETLKHPACTVCWDVRLLLQLVFLGESNSNFSWKKSPNHFKALYHSHSPSDFIQNFSTLTSRFLYGQSYIWLLTITKKWYSAVGPDKIYNRVHPPPPPRQQIKTQCRQAECNATPSLCSTNSSAGTGDEESITMGARKSAFGSTFLISDSTL